MKILILLMFILSFGARAKSFSQNQRVSMEMEQVTILEILNEIKEQTGLYFIYKKGLFDNFHKVSIEAENEEVKILLDELLREKGLECEVEEEVITFKELAKPTPIEVEQKKKELKGTVKDEDGNTLPGVSILVKGTAIGTATDIDGNYLLEIPADVKVLVFSFIGMESREIAYTGQVVQNVILSPDAEQMAEVVVVGYGVQTKANLIGSVTAVTGSELEQSTVTRVSETLAGRLPGLVTFKETGGPGSSTQLYVRGISSTGNINPLIVVDGIPGRDMNSIDPSEVESVTVLKDASSCAVYGARAANGVVLITTKKGKIGTPKITFRSNFTLKEPNRLLKPHDSYKYAEMINEAYKNEDAYNPDFGRGFTDEEIQKFKDGSDPDAYPNTDWYDEVLDPTSTEMQSSLSLSGGTEKTKYFFSLGYTNENGQYDALNYKRYNFRTNLETQVTKNLKVGISLGGSKGKMKDVAWGSSYVYSTALESSPIYVNQFSNGLYNYVASARGNVSQIANGDNGWTKNTRDIFNGDFKLEYKIPGVKGLSLKGKVAYDKTNSVGKTFRTPYTSYLRSDDGEYLPKIVSPNIDLRRSYSHFESMTYEGSVNYQNTLGKHNVGALLLYTQTEDKTDKFTAKRENFTSIELPTLNFGDATTATNSGTNSTNTRQGVVGRLKYGYDAKYLLELTFRYDGSDIFPEGERFGFFPSIAGAWVMSKESFFDDGLGVFDYLKLKGSWGILGNDRVSPFQYLSTYSQLTGRSGPQGYSFGGSNPQFSSILTEDVLSNPHITWEKAVVTNVGFETRLFKNKLSVEADYFFKRTKDILVPRTAEIPATLGVGLPSENNGEVENQGFEVSVSYRNEFKGVSYYVKPNLSYTKNKIVNYPEPQNVPDWQKKEGRSVNFGSVLGFVADGLYQSQDEIDNGPTPLFPVQPGDIKYKDIDEDGEITYADRKYISNEFPNLTFGLSLGADYKGFEINMLWQGAADVDKHYGNGSGSFAFGGAGYPSKLHDNYWSEENPNGTYPRLWINDRNNSQASTFWVEDASYVKLKNLELAYTLPKNLLGGIGINNLRLALSGTNLITITGLKHRDPEASPSLTYPLEKFYSFSISANF